MASGDTMLIWDATAGKPGGFSTGNAPDSVRNGVPIKVFADSADTSCIFYGVLPRRYGGGGLTVKLHAFGAAASATTVRWGAAIERGTTDIDADSFAADKTNGMTLSGTSGISTNVDIAFTAGAQMDSLAAAEPFRLKVRRDGNGLTGTDDHTADAQLWLVELRET